MNVELRNEPRRVIDNDLQADTTPAARQPIRIPYQTDTVLFGGWGVKL